MIRKRQNYQGKDMNFTNVGKLVVQLLQPKKTTIITKKAYFKRECSQMEFLMFVNQKLNRKNIKIIYPEKTRKTKLKQPSQF